MSGSIMFGLRLLLGLVLYVFLGWTLWLFWQDLRKKGNMATEFRIPALTLTLDDASRTLWKFVRPQILIGRDPVCECRIDDPTISARHARLSYHHGQWWVDDLHSRNGTLLNQQPVVDQVVLTSNDILQCGRIVFQVVLEDNNNPLE